METDRRNFNAANPPYAPNPPATAIATNSAGRRAFDPCPVRSLISGESPRAASACACESPK
jgi:hypothetical protein